MYICISTGVFTCLFTCLFICICVRTLTCMCICISTCVCVFLCVCIHIYIYGYKSYCCRGCGVPSMLLSFSYHSVVNVSFCFFRHVRWRCHVFVILFCVFKPMFWYCHFFFILLDSLGFFCLSFVCWAVCFVWFWSGFFDLMFAVVILAVFSHIGPV